MNKNLLIAIVIIACSLAYGLYLIIPQAVSAYSSYKELQGSQERVEQMKSQIEQLKKEQAEHERLAKVATKPIYKNEMPGDDPMSSFGVMFEDVIQAAKYNQLKLFSIAYNMAPDTDVVYKNIQSEYNVCEISMQLIGKYTDFSSYFHDIYNYPYLININKVDVKPYERDKSILVGDIKITLYSKK